MKSDGKKRKRGRPGTYTPKLGAEIEEWIANGQPLRAFCRRPGKPGWTTVYRWMRADDAFAARIAHAREVGGDAIAEEALRIADTPMVGVREEVEKGRKKTVREDMLGHRRLQVDTRLKLLAKWTRKYSPKVGVEHSGKVTLEDLVMASLASADPKAEEPQEPTDG